MKLSFVLLLLIRQLSASTRFCAGLLRLLSDCGEDYFECVKLCTEWNQYSSTVDDFMCIFMRNDKELGKVEIMNRVALSVCRFVTFQALWTVLLHETPFSSCIVNSSKDLSNKNLIFALILHFVYFKVLIFSVFHLL